MGTVAPLVLYDDVFIDSQNPTTNYVSQTQGRLGEYFGGAGTYRRLFIARVDLRSLVHPVLKAELKLYEYATNSHGAVTLNVRKLLKPYVASQITWNQYATGLSWDRDIANDDFSSTLAGSVAITDTVGYKTIDVTKLVNENLGSVLAFGVGFSGASTAQNTMLVNMVGSATNKPVFEVTIPAVNDASLIQAMKNDAPSALWPHTDRAQVTGQLLDVSGNARHLTTSYLTSPPYQATAILPGGDPVFDPTTNVGHERAYEAWMSPGAGDFLFTCFFKGSVISASDTSFETLITMDLNDTGNGWIVYVSNKGNNPAYPQGTVRVWYAGTVFQNTIALQNGVSLVDGNLHQIWVEKRSGIVTIFVDGYAGASGAAGTPTSQSGAMYFGTAYSGAAIYRQLNASGYYGLWVGGTIPARSRMAEWRRKANMSLLSGADAAVFY